MHFQQLHNLISQKVLPPKGSFQNPTNSCNSILPGSASGKYWIQSTATGYASHEYCDMANTRCGTRGWMRVANLNMTNTSQRCPSGFRYASGSGYRGCAANGRGCVHTTFPVHGVRYSKVCGRVNAYQYFSPNAFWPYYTNRALTIDSAYVDGVSLTHGQYPRQHIWTFAAALDEIRSQSSTCPCSKTTTTYTGAVPPFIGQDYFCDTGSRYNVANLSLPGVHQESTGYRAQPWAMPATSIATWPTQDVGPGGGWGWQTLTWLIPVNTVQVDFAMLQEVATEGVVLMVGAVYTPPSLCMEYGTAKYVAGWMPINIALLMHFSHTMQIEH